jgi:hypothetical protein
METAKTPSAKITRDPPASGKKAEIHHSRSCFWGRGKVRSYETYLHFFLGKSDEKNMADLNYAIYSHLDIFLGKKAD